MIRLDIVSISNLDRNVTIFLFVYRNHITSPRHTRPPRSIEQNKVRFKCCYELVIFVRSNTQAAPSGLQMTPPSLPGTENPGMPGSPDFILIMKGTLFCLLPFEKCIVLSGYNER